MLAGKGKCANGRVLNAGRTAWANDQNNILFGQPFDVDKYQQAISTCCLQQDLEALPVRS